MRLPGNCKALSLHPEELAIASVSKDEATSGASWFETALTHLLTMRVLGLLLVRLGWQKVHLVGRRNAHDLGWIGQIVQLVEQRLELLHR